MVLLEDGARLAGQVQKKIIGVKHFVTEELKSRRVEAVAARFCNQADVGAAVASIACIVKASLNLELLNAVRVWNWNSATPGRTALHVIHANSVQLKVVVIGACPVDINSVVGVGYLGKSRPSDPQLACVVHPRNDPWRETDDLSKVPRDQRKVAYRCLVDDLAECGTVGLDH